MLRNLFKKYFGLGSIGLLLSGSFPEPLTETEEAYYLEKFKDGDEDARNILIERNLRLVAHIVKKYSAAGENDDLISIGTIGLIKGISSFDTKKKTKLATYVARCIENEILMSIRHDKKFANQVSLSEPIGFDSEGNEVSLMDVLQSENEDICEKIDRDNMIERLYKKIKSTLAFREQEIIRLRYGLCGAEPKTQREVAMLLGISRSYVSRIEKKALGKLGE
ncbi:MAG: RNA polymerase sporulation sigma factor SigK [Clostridia bacterium]|nr:RNA polymerase sporulation sigma factor SigK [Clostridia bacterium]